MPVIIHRQYINAPIELCFDLARNVEVHTITTSKTMERAVGGVTKGMLENGDIVIWEAIHFGVKQKLAAKVIFMDKPYKFIDIMLEGAFHSFTHTHEFIEMEEGTEMIDHFQYKSPFGLLGRIIDYVFLERYMSAFLSSRAKALKEIAEN
ncbi:SRPBCC family protein [Bacillus sp. JJ722]|uniref:SRPBCC family protein n=1 Tax=Bacillus sp. JJ722 TaxID=3122973 RepID=UPI002FFE58EE